jgi:hypothetical protein
MPNKGDWRMYFLCALAIVNSATNGYDGSMMNGLQTLKYWVDCKYLFGMPNLSVLNADNRNYFRYG